MTPKRTRPLQPINPPINQKRLWQGRVVSVQPRIRLSRSFDERSHSYLGYVLRLSGTLDDEAKEFVVAVGKGAHEEHQFHVGDQISGKSVSVSDTNLEIADVYKTSALNVLAQGDEPAGDSPPYMDVPPPLEIYRERGHRRLSAVTYAKKCTTCTETLGKLNARVLSARRPRFSDETAFRWRPATCRTTSNRISFSPNSII